jgi:hypothetical protein
MKNNYFNEKILETNASLSNFYIPIVMLSNVLNHEVFTKTISLVDELDFEIGDNLYHGTII